MAYVFPGSDFDRPQKLLALLGSFWSRTYDAQEFVQALTHARGQAAAQTHLDLLELTAAISRFELPIFHRESWYFLSLKKSEMNLTSADLAKYDGVRSFDGSFQFDVPLASTLFTWPAPTDLARANVIVNRITDASRTYVHGVDFELKEGTIRFRVNPFDDELISRVEVTEENEVVDEVAGLWLYRGEFDWKQLHTQFGYALNLQLTSSQRYKDYLNAIFDALVEGTTERSVQDALAALADVPLVREPSETVEQIETVGDRLWIITDKHTYRFSTAANPVVSVGDTVRAGDFLTDAVRRFSFNRGQLDAGLRSLALGRGFLASGFYQDIVFENKEVPLEVSTDEDGMTRVEFEVQGFPGDVEKFWDDVHAAGKAAGQTLAHLLDTRTNKTGEPGPVALPATVNPLEFMVQNLFRGTLEVAVVRPAAFGEDALGLSPGRLLRKIVPPHTALILYTELQYVEDPIRMEGPGTETEPGYEETVSSFVGTSYAEAIDPGTYVTESVRIVQIGGRCR